MATLVLGSGHLDRKSDHKQYFLEQELIIFRFLKENYEIRGQMPRLCPVLKMKVGRRICGFIWSFLFLWPETHFFLFLIA